MAGNDMDDVAGEHALREDEVDRLGFSEVAKRVANSIVDRASVDGLVIGLDGEWGSGKSSLLHLIEQSLKRLGEDLRPTIINFRPWLVGDRDALLTSLFDELADKVARVRLARGDASDITIKKAKKTAAAVRRFANALSKTGDLVETAGALWKPLEIAGKGLKAVGIMADKKEESNDLASLKAVITKDLLELNHRFIVTIDDVDRLEPAEVIEVLRLVRSVADFPNIIYLLCYDASRLAEAIENGSNVRNGAAYLEKIVQLTVMIPKPEPFELRHWFDEEAGKLLGLVSYEVRERLKAVIDQEGAIQLRTPRSVVRTLDSIRFFWPAVRGEQVDVADLVWLQLIKDGSPNLYRWIETYVASVAATSFGTATVSEGSQAQRLDALLAAADQGQLKDLMYRHMFAEIIPGIATSFDNDGPPIAVHQKVSAQDRQAAIDGRRLASPDHYRLYFSLIGPTHAITQAGFNEFWNALDTGPAEAKDVLLTLHKQSALGTLRKSDVLFERLRNVERTAWSGSRAKNMLLAFGIMMDDAYRIDPNEENFIVSSWDRAERLVPILYLALHEAERATVTQELFANSPSIGWLTALLRRETFAHGHFGGQAKPSSEWYLSAADFTQAYEIMRSRYQSMTIDDLLSLPRAIQVLFAWNQIGDKEGPRALIDSAIISDEGLVKVLGQLTSSVNSSDRGRYTVLKQENVRPFADYEEAVSRLKSIARDGPAEFRADAQRLLGALADAVDL